MDHQGDSEVDSLSFSRANISQVDSVSKKSSDEVKTSRSVSSLTESEASEMSSSPIQSSG